MRPVVASSMSTMACAVQNPASLVDEPANYRPHIIPAAHLQPVPHIYQHQQLNQHRHGHQYMQAKPMRQAQSKAAPQVPQKRQSEAVGSAVTSLLPYCTTEVPLSEEQVIAVTDIAGSLKELVLLALGAKDGDGECVSRLEGALGSEQATVGVVDFFSDEYEV